MQKTKGVGTKPLSDTTQINFLLHQGNVGDSFPDKKTPCYKQVCSAVSKKAATWIKFPDL